MENERTYYAIYQLMNALPFDEPLEDEFIAKGNLAYLIDVYFGTKELDELFNQLKHYVKQQDLNNACYLVGKAIYEKALQEEVEEVYHDQYRVLFRMMEVLHQDGELISFWMVGRELFPEWFATVDFVMS